MDLSARQAGVIGYYSRSFEDKEEQARQTPRGGIISTKGDEENERTDRRNS